MKVTRTTIHVSSALVFGAAFWLAGCSSGLGNNLPKPPAGEVLGSSNQPVGLDLGLIPTDPVGDLGIAGVVIPGIGGGAPREVVLLGFKTAAAADDGDGSGTPLSRDAVADGNAADDVFVAAICAQDIEKRAFSQSLAGKFRHPRCTTCHSMQAADTLAFVSSSIAPPAGPGQPHAGPLPGPTFPNNDPVTCAPCHVTSNTFPVPGWQAPAASFDFRQKTVAQLAQAAMNVPTGETDHFRNDRRVLWALDSGVLPQVGGRNGAADDNHNGIVEPEDTDGTKRTVPGGSVQFLQEIDDWRASGMVTTAAGAVRDLTLVSRATGDTASGNGASNAPKLLWVANPTFDPTSAATAAATNPIGTLYVVYQSSASDLVAGDTNGAQDVFRATIQLRAEEDAEGTPLAGGLNLQLVGGSTQLISARDGTTTPGNGASGKPVIAGPNGEIVAFESAATDLVAGFTDGNGAANDVYVRLLLAGQTALLSSATGGVAVGGDGASGSPTLSGDGDFIAFASAATDLIGGDSNGVRDVFYARISTGAPYLKTRASVGDAGAPATGGDSDLPSIHVDGAGRVRIAFESTATNLVATTGLAASNVYLYDGNSGASTLLNQRIAPTGSAIGDGDAHTPVIANDGASVAFASASRNIDVVRPDGNRASDIFVVETAQVALGNVLPFRVSIGATTSADGDGDSTAPVFGSFVGSVNYPVGFVAYATAARNLGTSDSTPVVVSFLAETSGVIADFDVSTVRGAAPLTVQFTDRSSGSPTAWQWDFNDDGIVDSTAQNPSHVFTPGLYTVRLVASNRISNGSKTRTDLVLAVGPVVADFTASSFGGPAGLSVTFTDQSTQSPTAWQWDFENDGTIDSTDQNPTHVYTTPGSYTVRLVATNEVGPGEVTKTGFITIYVPAQADFSGSPLAGLAPLQVQFTDLSTGAFDSWAWDFENDGVVDSTAQSPSFTYASPGNYTVRLVVSGNGGTDVETKTDYVAVAGPVVANFTADAIAQYDNVPVNFTDTSTGTVSSWAWDFENDGTVDSTAQNPSHVYTTPGVYSVKLVASGPGGTDDEVKVGFITSVASSLQVTIEPAKDTSMYSENPGNSNGAATQMVCGNAANAVPTQVGVRRALVEFDVTSQVPTGSTILSAQLQMSVTYNPATPIGAQTITLRRVTREWGEGTTVGATIGQGAAATGGDATWSHAVATTTNWTNPGGDFTGSITASTSVAGVGTYTWGSTATMVSDIQGWVNVPSSNHGWILRSSEVALTRTTKVFGSREFPTAPERPKLTITYKPPLP